MNQSTAVDELRPSQTSFRIRARIRIASLRLGAGNRLDCGDEGNGIRRTRYSAPRRSQSATQLGLPDMDSAAVHGDHRSCRVAYRNLDCAASLVSKSIRDWERWRDADVPTALSMLIFDVRRESSLGGFPALSGRCWRVSD
jgi:hypothetical protein